MHSVLRAQKESSFIVIFRKHVYHALGMFFGSTQKLTAEELEITNSITTQVFLNCRKYLAVPESENDV